MQPHKKRRSSTSSSFMEPSSSPEDTAEPHHKRSGGKGRAGDGQRQDEQRKKHKADSKMPAGNGPSATVSQLPLAELQQQNPPTSSKDKKSQANPKSAVPMKSGNKRTNHAVIVAARGDTPSADELLLQFPGLVRELQEQKLRDDEIVEIVEHLGDQGFDHEERLLEAVQECLDMQSIVQLLMLFGFKGAPACYLASAIEEIRTCSHTSAEPERRSRVRKPDLPGSARCPTLDELLDGILVSPDHFHGLERDLTTQTQRLGPFAKQGKAVIPVVRAGHHSYMDLRFADFVEGGKPELAQLVDAADIRMLETSATGKTSTIFDYGRMEENYLIYIRCAEPETETNEQVPEEFSKQPEKVFPTVIKMIEEHANTTKGVESLRANVLPALVPHEGSQPQLAAGQGLMLAMFNKLKFRSLNALTKLISEVTTRLAGLGVPIKVALDEAQIASAKFATKGACMCFEYMDNELEDHGADRGLLYQYIYVLKHSSYVAADKVIVAGTGLVHAAIELQMSSQLGKLVSAQIIFPVLDEEDVKERLNRLLNLDGVRWDEIENLSVLTGRCRWTAALIQLLEKRLSRMSKQAAIELNKEQFMSERIRELAVKVRDQLVDTINSRLSSTKIPQHTKDWELTALQTVYVICCLFHKRSLAVRMMFSEGEVDLCLALGIGQLAGLDAMQEKLVVFDEMTSRALKAIAKQRDWNVSDIVADKLIAKRDNNSPSERGLDFQVVVAAALFKYGGHRGGFCANLRATGFISLDEAVDVRKFFLVPKTRKGIICQPDNKHRGDGFAIIDDPIFDYEDEGKREVETQIDHEDVYEAEDLQEETYAVMVQDVVDSASDSVGWGIFDETEAFAEGREHQLTSGLAEEIVGNGSAYELDYSVKLQQEPIGGVARTDNLLSTAFDRAYELKSSTIMKNAKEKSQHAQATGKPQTSDPGTADATGEGINETRRAWIEEIYPQIYAITGGRRLRLHVNIGGYAGYDERSYQNKWDHETGIDEVTKNLKKVHVEGEQVRVIIDKTNYHHLFRSSVCRDIIATIIAEDETLHQQA